MTKELAQNAQKLIESSKNIIIIGHKNPDGDAVGSTLGLHFFLKNYGVESTVVLPNDFPDFLKWMPGVDTILNFEKQNSQSVSALENADLIFTLDFNSLSRVGEMQGILEKSDANFIMIDHHQQPDAYATVTYSDPSIGSTCEMVHHFIEGLGKTKLIDADIATLLYTGIMTDTGSFRFPSTTATTHKVIADLLNAGANNAEIHQNVYDANSMSRMKLLGIALDNLHILKEYNTAYITMSQEELDANNFKKGDTEGFVNYALSVTGIIFAVIFIENKQEKIVKMSLRSKGDFSVNEVARAYYNGGGHNNAAGGRSELSLEETVKQFISILPQYKEALTA
ncbi:exopolyphosphatase [Patiriisocius marinistellae]|uniref:Exopolyphosphatase n=1 Tax=Patiriisocius marinistellae TaxID=2494560 RepID=A0A5J4G132_9FLAO|nr:bifunctional oligoribonuclease/PAP phosphatase NrnA [Patiriisocius marinistellae]GEQ86075.1 exopolyphosphatase [Patiriisocius marinistellae]